MKRILIVCAILLAMESCKSNDIKTETTDKQSSDSLIKQKKAVLIENKLDDLKKDSLYLANTLSGTWALIGSDNASFKIEEGKIFYPEALKTYKFKLHKNSLKIKFDDYEGIYLIKMRGIDTLVLKSDDDDGQVYYRFKK